MIGILSYFNCLHVFQFARVSPCPQLFHELARGEPGKVGVGEDAVRPPPVFFFGGFLELGNWAFLEEILQAFWWAVFF